LAPGVVLELIDREAVLLKRGDEAVFSLNDTGARIAELISSGVRLDHVVEALSEEYGCSRTRVEGEVVDLVHTLSARGLVVTEPSEGPTAHVLDR
jgi:hypothetical protein